MYNGCVYYNPLSGLSHASFGPFGGLPSNSFAGTESWPSGVMDPACLFSSAIPCTYPLAPMTRACDAHARPVLAGDPAQCCRNAKGAAHPSSRHEDSSLDCQYRIEGAPADRGDVCVAPSFAG